MKIILTWMMQNEEFIVGNPEIVEGVQGQLVRLGRSRHKEKLI